MSNQSELKRRPHRGAPAKNPDHLFTPIMEIYSYTTLSGYFCQTAQSEMAKSLQSNYAIKSTKFSPVILAVCGGHLRMLAPWGWPQTVDIFEGGKLLQSVVLPNN